MMQTILKFAVVLLTAAVILFALNSCKIVDKFLGKDEIPETENEKPEDTTEKNDGVDDTEPAQITITFDFGGAALPEGFKDTVKITEGGKITLPELEKEGYNFIGWFVGDTPITEADTFDSDTSISAKWEIKKVTVIFKNFFGETVSTQTVDWGTAATAPAVDTEAQGKPFHSWSADFSAVKADITVTPIYDFPSYTVTFNTNGGSYVAPAKVYLGEKPSIPEVPYKPGYTLVGWYFESTFENECKFDTALDKNTTLFAKYNLDYLLVSSAEDLNNIRNNTAEKYILTTDIDYKGNEWIPIESFSGIIDGNGHKIFNYDMSSTADNIGFINKNSGIIKNLSFDNFNIEYKQSTTAGAFAGVIVAYNTGTVEGCNVLTGDINYEISMNANVGKESYVAGIIGCNKGTVSNCSCTSDVNLVFDKNYRGGLYIRVAGAVGRNEGLIEKTEFRGKITTTSTTDSYNMVYVGGITAENISTSTGVFECASYAEISVTANGNARDIKRTFTGVIAGYNMSTVSDCYAEGTISVTSTGYNLTGSIGGAVGHNAPECTVTNIYAEVDITVSDAVAAVVGGIVGANESGAVTNKSVYAGNITLGAGVSSYGFIIGAQTGAARNCYHDSESALIKSEIPAEPTCTIGEAKELSELLSESFIFDTLYWDKDIWQANESTAPSLKLFAE